MKAVSAPGGLVQVVRPALERRGGRWLVATVSDEDREVARRHPRGWEVSGFTLQMLDLPPELHRLHYEVVSVECLYRLFHYLFRLPLTPVFDGGFADAWAAFLDVNRRYAEAALAAPETGPILLQDMHVMGVARAIRRSDVSFSRPLVYFHHVPWCAPDYFELLPAAVADDVMECMLAHDVVTFHSPRWARSFLDCCRARGVGALDDDGVRLGERRVRVLACPAPLDVGLARAILASPEARRWVERFERERAGRWMLTRVDRVDLWKNVLNGFRAFELLLDRRSDLVGRVWFLALLTPARDGGEYRRYLAEVLAEAQRVNERHTGVPGGPPVTVDVAAPGSADRARALAGLEAADTVLISSVFDGLNLVAKEAAIAGDAAVLLSRNTGVWEQFREWAVPVDPCDVAGTSDAIARAYDMDAAERAARAARMRALVESESAERWVEAQLTAAGPA